MERRVVVVVSLVLAIWMVLLATRMFIVPFDEPDYEQRPPPEVMSLNIGFMDSVDSLNPNIGLNEASWFFYSLVYDCLTTFDNDMSPTGNLAREWWVVSESDPEMVSSGEPYGSVWQYNLTDNAQWHDGVHFTADDVVYTLNLNAQHIDEMWAYQPYSYFIKEAEKVDNYTVRVHFWDRDNGTPMPVPWAYFIPIHIMPKHLLEQLPGGYSYIGMNWTGTYTNETSPNMPLVGTGPWIAAPTLWADWIGGRKITLVKNPDYHWELDKPGNPEVNVNKLVMEFYRDSTSLFLALENRELDIAKLPPTAYQEVSRRVISGELKGMECFSDQSCSQGFIYLSFWMDTAGGPNDARLDPDVRRAMAMAIDKDYLVDSILLGQGEPGTTVVPPVNINWHCEPIPAERIPYNLTVARELLDSAGYIDTDSDGIRECTISSKAVLMNWVDEGEDLHFEVPVLKYHPEDKDIALYVISKWKEIGVDAKISVYDYDLWSTMCPIQMDVSVSRWEALDPDPEFILFAQSDAARYSWSDTRYSNSSYNSSFMMSASSLNLSLRQSSVDDCQRILYNESPYIVLAYPNSSYVWHLDSIAGWGDWKADPGRSLDACWGANPLFFDLSSYYAPPPATEPQSSPMSTPLNVVIAVAAVSTVVVFYLLWKRGPGAAQPPRTGR